MKTIALRFGEQFSPECGTIAAHQELIDKLGFVWYGKMGTRISASVVHDLLENDDPKMLLIESGGTKRYWARVSDIMQEKPHLDEIPDYYRYETEKFKTWFKIVNFELAPKDIMRKCRVISSGTSLSETSKHSMSPYFIIETDVNL